MLLKAVVIAILVTAASGAIIRNSPFAPAQVRLETIATVGGQPDDVVVDRGGHLVWGDLATNTVRRLAGTRVHVIARGINVPEGIVAVGRGAFLVTEQGRDRIDRVDGRGRASVIFSLQPVSGQEGVDGIGWDRKTNSLLIPDSPRGRVLALNLQSRRARLLASGLGRPVDAAVDPSGSVLVPDEHLGTLVSISTGGRVSYLGTFNTPDDVAVDTKGTVWVTSLGDGGLWDQVRGGTFHRVIGGLANPQGMTLDACGDPVVVEQGKGRIDRFLLPGKSKACRL